ncbi:MAG: hypothetical protein ACI9D4_001996 [Polaribacter sp.]|jgi:hypothetical protein
MENLKELNLQTLDNSELESVEGGTPLVGAVALAAGGGLLLGGLIVGAVVAYGICYLLDKAVTR